MAALLLAAPIGARAQNLFVSGQDPQGNGVVHEYSPTGADLGTFASVGQGAALGLAFTGSGDLLVANNLTNTIHKFSPTGANLGVFASTGLNNVQGLAINPAGDVFAANYGDGTVHEFSPTGADMGTFANVSAYQLGPVGVGFNSSGDLYVSASIGVLNGTSGIFEFSPTGTVLGIQSNPLNTAGLAVNAGGDVFVDAYGRGGGLGSVWEYSPTLFYMGQFGSGLNTPYGNAFNSSGDLFTADGDNTIHEFSPTNADLGTFVSTGAVSPFFVAFSSPAATPEPGSLALAGGALMAGVLLYRPRRDLSAK